MDRLNPKRDPIRLRIAKSCRKMSATRASNYRRVVLALYLTAEDDGPFSVATNGEIGELAGLKAATVGGYVRQAEADKLVKVFRPGPDCVRCRIMIFKDQRGARSMIRCIEAYRIPMGSLTEARA